MIYGDSWWDMKQKIAFFFSNVMFKNNTFAKQINSTTFDWSLKLKASENLNQKLWF